MSTTEHPLRAKFLRTYANIPMGIRNDICGVHSDKGPFTWNVAYIEIEQKTPLGDWMLSYLRGLSLI